MANNAVDATQWSSAQRLGGTIASWVPDEDQPRLQAYTTYENIYWSEKRVFQLLQRGIQLDPLYVPVPREICDTTAHYFLKGLSITTKNTGLKPILDDFLTRERFKARFDVAKASGVVRGDFVLHMTADPDADPTRRISLNSVDPAQFFPVWSDDDPDVANTQHLAYLLKVAGREVVRRLTYFKDVETKLISREQLLVKADANALSIEGKASVIEVELPLEDLPSEITQIPIYHFKNIDWQGQPFGSSELRGYERIMAGIDQTMSDEELTLALEGLGVYATDSGAPVDDQGQETNWEIYPGVVIELASGSSFKRVEGVKSITPMLDHIRHLQDTTLEASATFRAGMMDVAVAQSGIALSIRFLPTLAKLESRDLEGISRLDHLFFDWKIWLAVFEQEDFQGEDITVEIGDKLPVDRAARLTELNNMLDRHVITKQYYREECEKLGYVFPDNMNELLLAEYKQQRELEFQASMRLTEQIGPDGQPIAPAGVDPNQPNSTTKTDAPNQSNNKGQTNESNGNEVGHTPTRQQRSPA